MTDLNAKIAIVTGGGSGIGQGIALALAREGAKVVVCGRRADPLGRTVVAIEKTGGDGLALQADVSRTEDVERLTTREREVLKLAAVGYSNKDIAKELSITQDTVKKHMQSILGKLHASSRIHAAIQATRAGIIQG